MKGMNKYEENYKLHTIDGMEDFLYDYGKLNALRFETTDFELCDFLIDFEKGVNKVLTDRQRQIFELHFLTDMRQEDVAKVLGITQQTVQESARNTIKNLVSYHEAEAEKERGAEVDV